MNKALYETEMRVSFAINLTYSTDGYTRHFPLGELNRMHFQCAQLEHHSMLFLIISSFPAY